jgi:parvulin-like peptidyl-prolyl isomerase
MIRSFQPQSIFLAVALAFSFVVPAAAEIVVADGEVTMSRAEFEKLLAETPDKIRVPAATDMGDRFALINEVMVFRKLVAKADAMQPGDPGYDELQARLDGVKRQFIFDREVGEYLVPDLDALARERYATQKDKYAKIPETRASSHILFSSPPGLDRTELRKEAAVILEELRNGADFEEYVEKYSEDPGSSQRGGSLDRWIRFGDPGITPPYSEALFEIDEIGGYSEVTDSQFGLHIIRLDGIRESSYKSFEEVRNDIMRDLVAEQRKLAAKAVNERYFLSDEAFIDGDAMDELFEPYAQ